MVIQSDLLDALDTGLTLQSATRQVEIDQPKKLADLAAIGHFLAYRAAKGQHLADLAARPLPLNMRAERR